MAFLRVLVQIESFADAVFCERSERLDFFFQLMIHLFFVFILVAEEDFLLHHHRLNRRRQRNTSIIAYSSYFPLVRISVTRRKLFVPVYLASFDDCF
jgi:hypothetical protein